MSFGNMNFGNMNLESMFKARQAWSEFKRNHPKDPVFMDNVQNKGYCEDMEIAIAVRYPDGTEYKTGIRVKPSDLEMLNMLKTLR